MTMIEVCQNCKFYRYPYEGKGHCHAHPPQALLKGGMTGGTKYDDFAVFPRVQENDWCGEFAPGACYA